MARFRTDDPATCACVRRALVPVKMPRSLSLRTTIVSTLRQVDPSLHAGLRARYNGVMEVPLNTSHPQPETMTCRTRSSLSRSAVCSVGPCHRQGAVTFIVSVVLLFAWAGSPTTRAADDDKYQNMASDSDLERGDGIAAGFAADEGITKHADVIFADNFETGPLGATWDSAQIKAARSLPWLIR